MLEDLIESVNNISLFFITESQRKLFLITIVITDKQNVHSHQKKVTFLLHLVSSPTDISFDEYLIALNNFDMTVISNLIFQMHVSWHNRALLSSICLT